MLYKYRIRAFPYADLVAENARRGTDDPEYELLDTGIFAEDRYFDIFVEYAQVAPGDILMKITACNRGPSAMLHLIPQLVLRNTWTWEPGSVRPELRAAERGAIAVSPDQLGISRLYFDGNAQLLFTENETNTLKLWNIGAPGHFKDAVHECIIEGRRDAVNPAHHGTKAGVWFQSMVAGGHIQEFRLRLSRRPHAAPFKAFENSLEIRRREADEYYAELQKDATSADERIVQRQAFAGLIWSNSITWMCRLVERAIPAR